LKCDLCSKLIPGGHRLKVRDVDIEAILDTGEPVELLKSRGDWIACGFCWDLLRIDAWDGLRIRMLTRQQKLNPGMPAPQLRQLVSSVVNYLQLAWEREE
jgi:hypothetical protein